MSEWREDYYGFMRQINATEGENLTVAYLNNLEAECARLREALLTIAGSVEHAQWDAWDCAGFAVQALEPTAAQA